MLSTGYIFGDFTQNFCGWNVLCMEGERGHKPMRIFFFQHRNCSLLLVVRFDSLRPPLTEEVGPYLHRHLRVRMGLSGREPEK